MKLSEAYKKHGGGPLLPTDIADGGDTGTVDKDKPTIHCPECGKVDV